MKAFSLLTTLALAALAMTSTDAAKCALKTKAPAPAPAPAPGPGSAPAVTSKAPTPAASTPAAADNDTPAAGGGGGGSKSAGCGKTPTLKAGVQKISVGNDQREYTLYVPQNYDSSKPYKLIFTLHWRGGSMGDAVRNAGGWYGLQALAKETAIFVAPNGKGNGWANGGGEDVRFIDEIIKTMDSNFCINTSQRFSTGFSWGAGMSHALACGLPDKIRAVSLIAGGLISGCDGGNKPVAYQLMHGNNDGVLAPTMGKSIMNVFVKANGCTPQDPPLPASNSGTHIKTEFKGCKPGYPVVFTGFDGGHVAEPSDRGGKNFAPEETWKFFSQF